MPTNFSENNSNKKYFHAGEYSGCTIYIFLESSFPKTMAAKKVIPFH